MEIIDQSTVKIIDQSVVEFFGLIVGIMDKIKVEFLNQLVIEIMVVKSL